MAEQQNTKALARARQSLPHLTFDDLLNPHDFVALQRDSIFNYEDGMTSGIQAAQAALRAKIQNLLHSKE